MASSLAARLIFISRAAESALKSTVLSPIHARPTVLQAPSKKRAAAVGCLISGFDGGGVSDEFVSTRKSGFSREFSVIANMLKKIEPLDNSVISKGVSDAARDSMKQTISTMLGLLASDQFRVVVRVSKEPLDRLIVSSIVTGYTLWNAEYRISLMRNFSLDSLERSDFAGNNGVYDVRWEKRDGEGIEKFSSNGVKQCAEEESEKKMNLGDFGILSQEELNYIQQLEYELSQAKQELNTRRRENLQMEHMRKSNNNLLDYLRALEPYMVTELSKPSSPEVEEFIHELAQSTLRRCFKDEISDDYSQDLDIMQSHQETENEVISTSRDYFAKLLFWCMLLGHHLRGLENRLHLSCVVGLL